MGLLYLCCCHFTRFVCLMNRSIHCKDQTRDTKKFMRLPIYQKLLKKNEQKEQSLFQSLIYSPNLILDAFFCNSFSGSIIKCTNSTNSTGILPPLSQEEQQQLGTSFDVFLKHRIAAMNAAGIPVNYTAFNSSNLNKAINICTSYSSCYREWKVCL
jgi:hypothetical protein